MNKLLTLLLISFVVLFSHQKFTYAIGVSDYHFERLWPKIDQPWYFNEPRGIAITPAGLLFIADTFNHRIQVLNDQGELVRIWGIQGDHDAEFQVPYGIAVSPKDGSVFVTDVQNNVVQAFTQQGNFIGKLAHQFNNPVGIAVSQSGNIYVADRDNHKIQVFNENGAFLNAWGGKGSAHGEFLFPEGLALAPNGNVYVVDTYNYRVQVFTPTGEFIREWGEKEGSGDGEFSLPSGITVSQSGLVFVTERVNDQNQGNHRVQVFDLTGNFIGTFGGLGKGQGKFNNPRGIAVSENGTIFVADGWNHRIQVFNQNAQFKRAWESEGSGIGEFRFPDGGISISSKGLIFIADTYNHRIQVFDQQGNAIRNWGQLGTAENEFNLPKGVVVEPDSDGQEGLVYVTDTDNNRIQVFDQTGKFVRAWGDTTQNADARLQQPRGIAISGDGLVFVVNQGSQRVQVFTRQGEFVHVWGKPGAGPGEFQDANGISISPEGEVFIADSANQRIQVFNQQGQFLRTWGKGGLAAGEFNRPDGVLATETGLIFVVETWNHRIQVFDKLGNFVAIWGGPGSLAGQLFRPGGMAFDKTGNFYVVDSGNRRIQKIVSSAKQTTQKHTRKAIILAGGGPPTDNFQNAIWDSTVILANKAQRILTIQGFEKEEIRYLTAGNTQLDLDGNAKNDDLIAATLDNLKDAIVNWASEAENVTIYLIDHGGPGKFQVNPHEILDVTMLEDWLNQLNNKIPGKISIVIEACRSGAFIPLLSAKNRHVISSANAEQPAVISNAGMNSFSYYFWNEINSGQTLALAFKTARQGMSAQLISGTAQNAQLDSNGDKAFNQTDFDDLSSFCIGNCITTAANPPSILKVSAPDTLSGATQAKFSMQVNTLEAIARAWVAISRIDALHTDIDQPVSDLIAVDLTCNSSNLCEGESDIFDTQGIYQLNFFARDSLGQLSLPSSKQLTQTNGNNSPALSFYDATTGTATIGDVQVQDHHYQVVLKQVDATQFKLVDAQQLASAQTQTPAVYNIIDLSLNIPQITVANKNYQATLINTGNFIFRLSNSGEI